MTDAIKSPKVNASQFCHRALGRIQRHIFRWVESCELGEDEFGRYFRFSFTRMELGGVQKTETFSVSRAMIEDGFMSEMLLNRELWYTLGRLRGMV